jgi:hypothetical protein
MGHDVNKYQLLHLMKEHIAGDYRVQEENKGGDRGGFQGCQRRGYGRGRGRGYIGGGGRKHTCFNCGKTCHLEQLYTNPCTLCGYFHSVDHVMEDFLELLEKWEDKKGNYNMDIVDSSEE